MGTSEQRQRWRISLTNIIIVLISALFTFMLVRIDRHMGDLKEQNITLQAQQKNTQELLFIEYSSTHWALTQMWDGEYTKLKDCKKRELMNDSQFIKGD